MVGRWILTRFVWSAAMVLILTACGGATADSLGTTTTTVVGPTAISLSGVGFEVHQEPG